MSSTHTHSRCGKRMHTASGCCGNYRCTTCYPGMIRSVDDQSATIAQLEAQLAEQTRERDEAREQFDLHVKWASDQLAERDKIIEGWMVIDSDLLARLAALRDLNTKLVKALTEYQQAEEIDDPVDRLIELACARKIAREALALLTIPASSPPA